MLNMLEYIRKRKYKIGTQEHKAYVVQPYGLRPRKKPLRATSLLYKSVVQNLCNNEP